MSIDPVSIGITLALTAASYGLQASQTIEGPRLEDLNVTSGEYGVSLPHPFGSCRVNCAAIYAEPLREVKKKRKTKGGKYAEYKYYGTWAVAVAGKEITAVQAIRFDTYLVYANGISPVTQIEEDGLVIDDYLQIYLGTSDQAINPRMQAGIDAALGAGSTPAYRDTAILMFVECPLEQVHNRLPTVEAEILANSAPQDQLFTYTEYEEPSWDPINFSPAYYESPWSYSPNEKYIYGNYYWADTSWVFNTETNALEYAVCYDNLPDDYFVTTQGVVDSDGAVYIQHIDYNQFYRVDLASPSSYTLIGTTDWADVDFANMRAFDMPDGNIFVVVYNPVATTGAQNKVYIYNKNADTFTSFYTPSLSASEFTTAFQDDLGDLWVGYTLYNPPADSTLHLRRLTNITGSSPYMQDITLGAGLPTILDDNPKLRGYFYQGKFVGGIQDFEGAFLIPGIRWAIAVNLTTGAIVDTEDLSTINYEGYIWPVSYTPKADQEIVYVLDAVDYGQNQSRDLYAFNPATLTIDLLSSYSLDVWNVTPVDPEQNVITNMYLPTMNAFVGAKDLNWEEGHLYFYFLGGGTLTLGAICDEVAGLAKITDKNFSALDQPVQGWYFLRSQALSAVEPLLQMYDSEIRLNGFTMEGIKRGGSTAVTIDDSEFLEDRPRYKLELVQPIELPKAIVVNFADINLDKQPNSVRDTRAVNTTDTADERTYNLQSWTSDPIEANKLTQVAFRRIWNSDVIGTQKLPNKFFNLLTGDNIGLVYDGEPYGMRVQKIKYNFEHDYMEVEAVYDEVALATQLTDDQTVGGWGMGAPPAGLISPVPSQGFAIDLPLIDDSLSWTTPQVLFASAPNTTGDWPGSTFWQYYDVDGDYTTEGLSFTYSEMATWGNATNILADANPNLWDRGNYLDVTVVGETGTFTSVTEAACEANGRLNLLLVGSEYIQFTTATLLGGPSWRLSGLRRGRRGTEWACATHGASEKVLLLENAKYQNFGLSNVGTNQSWKDITTGLGPTGADVDALSPLVGATLKPYAPAHLTGTKDSGSGDWTLNWVRRTRIGGAWTSGTPIPLSEASEEYELEIMNGVSVVRTFTGLTTPTATYTNAQQVTDFGSTQSTITFKVYQISDSVGRGYVSTITVTA